MDRENVFMNKLRIMHNVRIFILVVDNLKIKKSFHNLYLVIYFHNIVEISKNKFYRDE